MEDRIVQYPNRIRLVPVDGQPNTYDIEEVPGEVTSVGTPLSKATLMSDTSGQRYGLTSTDTVDDMFQRNVQILEATIPVSGWSSALTNGYYTNQVTVAGMKASYNPTLVLKVTSATLAEDERSAFGTIIECETFDGYVIARCLDKPDISFNVRFIGV